MLLIVSRGGRVATLFVASRIETASFQETFCLHVSVGLGTWRDAPLLDHWVLFLHHAVDLILQQIGVEALFLHDEGNALFEGF